MSELALRPMILYHAGCSDGFGAAYAAWRKLGDQADYIPVKFGSPPPDVTGREVYIVDFSYSRKDLIAMHKKAKSLLVLDHHDTAQKELAGLDFATFDMSKSGAVLAWNHFHPTEPPPPLLLYVQDRDLWKFSLPFSEEVGYALNSYANDFHVWDKIDCERLIEDGKILLRYVEQQVHRMEKSAVMGFIGTHKIPIVNTQIYQSEMGNHFAKHHPFSATYYVNKDGEYIWSLRSLNTDPNAVHVGIIAKQLVAAGLASSGGGHKNAAGFQTNKILDTSKPVELPTVQLQTGVEEKKAKKPRKKKGDSQ